MARIFDDSVEDEKSKVKKDGLIYQQRNDKDYKAEYEKLDSKGKFQFFKDYYLQTIVVIAVLVIVGGYYLYGSLTKPQTVLYVAVCDDNLDEKQVEKLEKAVGTYLGLDNKHEIVTINTDYNSSNGTLSEQLQSYIYAGTCDVVIAPKKGFMSYASAGYFLEPDTSDTVALFKDWPEKKRLYCPVVDGEQIRGEKDFDTTKYNFGIEISGCKKYKELEGLGKSAYAGITNSSKKQEEAAAFLKFLTDDTLKDGDVNPDFAEIRISYLPDMKMVESKSLKLYLFSFRNHGDFHEDCVNIIMKDLIKLMEPKYIEVTGIFTPRGGISIYPYCNYGRPGTKYEELAQYRLRNHDL